MTTMLIIYSSPPSNTGSSEDSSKNEGFLKSVWHKLTDKHGDASKSESKPESKGAKDADAKDSEKKENGKDETKNSS